MRTSPIPALSQRQELNFFAKVVAGSNNCHVWVGHKDAHGRGRFQVARIPRVAPRVAFMIHHGHDPAGQVIMHTCDNPSCVNPNHLVLGTQAENIADAKAKGRLSRGDAHSAANGGGKLNSKIVAEIKRRLANGERTKQIAEMFNVGMSQISNIKTGRKWAHV